MDSPTRTRKSPNQISSPPAPPTNQDLCQCRTPIPFSNAIHTYLDHKPLTQQLRRVFPYDHKILPYTWTYSSPCSSPSSPTMPNNPRISPSTQTLYTLHLHSGPEPPPIVQWGPRPETLLQSESCNSETLALRSLVSLLEELPEDWWPRGIRLPLTWVNFEKFEGVCSACGGFRREGVRELGSIAE